VALVWLLIVLLAAAPAAAAPVRLAPSSGEPGARATLRIESVPPQSQVELRVGRGDVRLVRANRQGRITVRQRIPHAERRRIRVALQDARGKRAVMHYRVRSRWNGRRSSSAADWEGRVVRVEADLRRGKLVAVARVRGVEPGARVSARFGNRLVARRDAGERGRTRLRILLPQNATGHGLVIRAEGARLEATLPTPPATIVAAGDIACEPPYETTRTECRHAEVAALADSLRPDAVVMPGDIQYEAGRFEHFQQSFHLSWGQLGAPLRPVPGNHEYRTPGAEGYYDYFEWQSGWRPPEWYAYDVGPWRLIALNSNCEEGRVDCSAGSEQERWLRANLENEPHRCTLAYWHHPRYSSGFHGSDGRTQRMWRILDEADAELAVAGHDHHYERFAPQDANGQRDDLGMRQLVVGTGGSHPSVVRHPRAPHSEYSQKRDFGVLLLRLYEDAYSWRFVRIPDGKVLDFGNGSCL
jgi:hypothetical protein